MENDCFHLVYNEGALDYLSRLHVFIEVARFESFAGAGRELGISTSAVSKHIQNLEHSLKVKLFHRTTRRVSLTEEGALFYERTRHALDDIEEAKEQLHDMKAKPYGTIKVSVPASFGTTHLKTPLASFAAQYPEVVLDVSFDDRMVNVAEEGFDLVIRIGALKDSSLIARKLIDAPIVLCASPDYLVRCGTPHVPDDLSQHSVVAYTRHKGAHEWHYRCLDDGRDGVVALSSRLKADSAAMMLEAGLQGLGLVIMPTFFVQNDIASGRLVTVLDAYETWPPRSVYAVFPPNRYLSTRVRLLIEHLDAYCQSIT